MAGPAAALLMTIGGLGGIGAWLIGSARCCLSAALIDFCPRSSARMHPRWRTPYIALLVQALLSALFILAATQGDTVKGAYQKLINAALIVYFIPYLYTFAAAIRLRANIARQSGAIPIPGGRWGSLFWNGVGC